MLNSAFSKSLSWLSQVFFFDEVRLFEVFSALNLLAWAELLLTNPSIIDGPYYRGFANEGAMFWALIFGCGAIAQFIGIFFRRVSVLEFRFAAMASASGCWTVIAWNFWINGISSTANLNYSLLAGACAICGAYLGWKSTSYQS